MTRPAFGSPEQNGTPDAPDYDDYEVDQVCKYCHGDGGDPYNDRIMPCPVCGGAGTLW